MTLYKSRITGHWIVDRHGTKDHPGKYGREDYLTFEGARKRVVEIINGWPRMYHLVPLAD